MTISKEYRICMPLTVDEVFSCFLLFFLKICLVLFLFLMLYCVLGKICNALITINMMLY